MSTTATGTPRAADDTEVRYQYADRTGQDALAAWLADHEPPPLRADDREAIARLITPLPSRTASAA
ncbi:hypothetical protein ACFVJS_06635 [Nocardioides sp. NPDC057772]|uniref:hypothetical protein n=1 Tax=Nocardioides sp. NPDC057772 TaxID=3346245 RepID=UPI00366A76C4